MKENREVLEIDIKRMAQALWKRAWIIVLVGVLCAVLLFAYSHLFMVPQYMASTSFYVNNSYGAESPGSSSSQLMAARDLADTYMVILKSRTVLNEVANVTKLGYSYSQLCGMISASAVNETEVFEVVVICPNYLHAAEIANAIADILPERISAVVESSEVRVVDYAIPSDVQVSPVYGNYAKIGLLIGVGLTAGVVVLMELLDTTITSEDFLARMYPDIPMLAMIPDAENSNGSGYYKGYYKGYYEAQKNYQTPNRTRGEK